MYRENAVYHPYTIGLSDIIILRHGNIVMYRQQLSKRYVRKTGKKLTDTSYNTATGRIIIVKYIYLYLRNFFVAYGLGDGKT